MKCYLPDVEQLGLAFDMLASPAKALPLLDQLTDAIKKYDEFLDQYPSVMVEFLEPVYQLARSLGALDANFLTMQLTELGGRGGIISGGLYALIQPAPELLGPLSAVAPANPPENTWACDCAIAEIKKQAWPAECHCLKPSITVIRDAVNRLGFPETPIRRELEPDEQVKLEEFREFTRRKYREVGIEQTNSAIRTREEYHWVVPYWTWVEEFANKDNCKSLYRRG